MFGNLGTDGRGQAWFLVSANPSESKNQARRFCFPAKGRINNDTQARDGSNVLFASITKKDIMYGVCRMPYELPLPKKAQGAGLEGKNP